MLAPHALQPGSPLGRYVLERFLGEGGFAEVWLARRADAPSDDPVAIKLVRRGRFGSTVHRTMFVDEANIAARLRHPNVASVLEIGDDQGMPFLVMEYVGGGSLETMVRGARAMNEPIPVGMAGCIAEELCAALHAAHELSIDGRPQQVVHRDVSPQNVLLTNEGVPKLIDFGIAKARERVTKQTSTGITKGKVSYMSPEQGRGEAIDRRADVWAIAAVLYELLEGERLLEGSSDIARLQALVSRPVRPVFDRTPPRLAAVVGIALSFHARDRYATADELRRAIGEALAFEGLRATSAQIAEFCRRACVAAELAVSTEAPLPELHDLLHPATADVTVSTVEPASRPAQVRRIGISVAAAIVGLSGIGLALRLGVGARSEPQTARPPEVSSAPSVAARPPAPPPAASWVPVVAAPSSAIAEPTERSGASASPPGAPSPAARRSAARTAPSTPVTAPKRVNSAAKAHAVTSDDDRID
jgi:serine/threonine-protein kinase